MPKTSTVVGLSVCSAFSSLMDSMGLIGSGLQLYH